MTTAFKNHFSSAAGYAAYRPVYPRALAEALAGLCAGRETAWDCGCGTGQLTALLAELFQRVIGTDASAEQIARATAGGNARFATAPAENSGLDHRSVDLVVAAQAAHWFDLPAFYQEVRRVARGPATVVALVTYGRSVIDHGPIDEAVERVYSGLLGPYWPPERAHVENSYRELPFPFVEFPPGTLPDLEMHADLPRQAMVGYINTWSSVRAAERAGVVAVMDRVSDELARAWPEGEVRTVRWPLALRLGTVG